MIRLASAGDIAFAALAGAALAMLCGGLSERARSRAQGLALAAIVVAAGIAAAWLADGRSRDRIWRTWAVMVAIGDALDMTRAANGHLPPAVGIPVADIEAALPEAVRGGLTFVDAWGQPILYTQRDGAWRLESLGLDARPGPYSDGPSRDFADDLVIRDGSPVAWPESPCAGGPRAPPSDPGLVDTRGRHGH